MQLRFSDEEIILLGTKCSHKYPYERDRGRFNRHTGRRQVTTEAEPRRVQPQTQGPLEPPEAERGRKDPPWEPLEGARTYPCLEHGFLVYGAGRQ